MKPCVYLIRNLVNGKVYVGKTNNARHAPRRARGIVLTYMNRAVPANRLDAAFLKTLLRHPTFRWIEASDNWVSIGC